MKMFIRLFAAIMTLAVVISCFGCSPDASDDTDGTIDTAAPTETEPETESETDPPAPTPYSLDIDGYTVVYPSNATPNFCTYLDKFCELLNDYTGTKIGHSTDSDSKGGREILLGNTSREETDKSHEILSESGLGYEGYIIRNENDKIVIMGKSEAVTLRAMKRFLMNYAKASDEVGRVLFAKGDIEIDVLDSESLLLDNFVEFSTEVTSEIASVQSSTADNSQVYSYESVIELAHNGEHNGTLIATHSNYAGAPGNRIYRSTDGGKSWIYMSTAFNHTNPYDVRLNIQASLFELPKDMGRFKEGTLFLADSSYAYNDDHVQTTAITLYYSTDLGRLWHSYCVLNTGLNYGVHLGVYEPFLYYDEETERVYCFYADENEPKADPGVQKLTCHYTEDMDNWSAPIDVINGDDQKLRPGMPCVTKMGNGEYFLAYEIYAEDLGVPVYYQKLKSLDEFNPKSYGDPLKTTDGKMLSASPWCAWSPTGGECGTLIVVGCGMYKSGAILGCSDMFVSFDYGETFIAIGNPIFVFKYGVRKIGYSPWVSFSEDGSILHYSTNTADYYYKVSVMYARVKIW